MYKNYGFCFGCNKITQFIAKGDWWRDSYVCVNCGSIPRERAVMYCVEKYYPAWRDLVIHESSPNMRGPSIRFQNEATNYIPSQYYSKERPGKIINGFRNENLEKLTFENNSIDLHITQDVFEHIIDPESAFKEIARTLKPGGAHIFTTPLVNKQEPSQRCAKRNENGEIVQLIFPEEYHGNPISNKGSLVTIRWGYDITTFIHSYCGLFTEIIYIDAVEYGIRAELIEVLITRKSLRTVNLSEL